MPLSARLYELFQELTHAKHDADRDIGESPDIRPYTNVTLTEKQNFHKAVRGWLQGAVRPTPCPSTAYVYPAPDFEKKFSAYLASKGITDYTRHEAVPRVDLYKNGLLFNVTKKEVCLPSGNLIDFMYGGPEWGDDPVDGAGFFEDLRKDPNYPLANSEARLIELKNEAIAKFLEDIIYLAEFGGGGDPTRKTLPILGALQKHKQDIGAEPLRVISDVDTSLAYLDSYMSTLSAALRSGKLAALVLHRLHVNFNDLTDEFSLLEKLAALFLGGTIGNPETHMKVTNPHVVELLKKLFDVMAESGGKIIIGQECTEDTATMMLAYFNDASARWTKNILHRVQRDLGAEFYPPLDEECTNWDLFTRWNTRSHCMEMGLKPKRDQRITLPRDWMAPSTRVSETFVIRAGTEMHTWNSAKYPAELFKTVLEQIGYIVENVLHDDTDPKCCAGLFLCTVPKVRKGWWNRASTYQQD